MGISFKPILDPNHPAREDGSLAVIFRITYQRTRRYYSLGIFCFPENWDKKRGRFRKSHDPMTYEELNHNLTTLESRAEKLYLDTVARGIPFSFEVFKNNLFTSQSRPLVFPFFDQVIKEMKERHEYKNAEGYQTVKTSLETFAKNNQLLFHDISVKFLHDYETHLINKGCSGNTLYNYTKTIRALYNKAISRGIAVKDLYPFSNQFNNNGYNVGRLVTATTKQALDESEVKKIMEFIPPELSELDDAKNLFLFSYFAWGMDFIDMAKLEWKKNIQKSLIVYEREKSGTPLRIPIRKPLQDILDHYRKFNNGKYVFLVSTRKHKTAKMIRTRIDTARSKYNTLLKTLGQESKIDSPIHSKTARHTFTTVLLRKGVPMYKIKQMLGHKSFKTTETYTKEFGVKELETVSELLEL